jgi:hypothetical protein
MPRGFRPLALVPYVVLLAIGEIFAGSTGRAADAPAPLFDAV